MKREQGLPAFGGARVYQPSAAPASQRLIKGDQGLSARLTADKPARSVAGFTMLELLITIVILCVLLGLAIPGFSSWLPKYRLRGATRDIYSNLQLAKMTAVKDRARCGVLFDVTNSRYRVVGSGPNRTFGDSDDVTLKTVNFSEYGSGIAYGHGSAGTAIGTGFDNNVTFASDELVFDSRGMPAGAVAALEYVYIQNNKNNTFAVGVGPSGVIVMRRWTGSAWVQ
jgi:type IV fimbrial biogenesis protein FimT